MSWYEARDWCESREMHLASLKTLSQIQAVSNEIGIRGLFGKLKSKN